SQDLGRRMEAAAELLHFEEAAQLRDQLAKLKAVQAQQIVTADADHDADVIAIAAANGEYCIALMFIRAGRSLAARLFFPRLLMPSCRRSWRRSSASIIWRRILRRKSWSSGSS